MPDKLKELQDLFYAEAKKYDVLPLDNSTLARWNTPRPSLTGGPHGLHLFGRTDRRADQRRAEHPEQVLHHHRRGRDPRGRRGRHDRHRRRALRRLRAFPEQGRVRASAGASRCSSTTCSTSSARSGKGRSLSAGKHTIVFDFKSDGPGLGKGGTGVLSVDGKEVARKSMEHTTPITFPEDETFDVGLDTRTGVALLEYRYDPPFKFTGKIDKLTFKLEPEPRPHAESRQNWGPWRHRSRTLSRHRNAEGTQSCILGSEQFSWLPWSLLSVHRCGRNRQQEHWLRSKRRRRCWRRRFACRVSPATSRMVRCRDGTRQCCVRKQSAFIRWIGIASGSRSRLCSTAAGACADRPFRNCYPAGPAGGVFVCPARAVLIPNPSPASGCAFLHNARDAPLNIKL